MFKIYAIAIISRSNSPLYMRTAFPCGGGNDGSDGNDEASSANKELFERNVFSLLDTIESISKIKTVETDPHLGLLATINTYSYYAYLSPCMVKIIISGKFDDIQKSLTWKEALVRARLREIYSTWCISLLNIFIPVKKRAYPPLDLYLNAPNQS
ncbi:hypothetical protein MDAP_002060 [Mitosporidium daphniae]